MEKTSNTELQAPTWNDLVTLTYETRRISHENAENFDREMKEWQEKFEQEKKESKEKFEREKKEWHEKFEQEKKESKEKFEREKKEYNEKLEKESKKREEEWKELRRIVREMSYTFISQTGHIVEGLMEPSALKLFQSCGFDIDKCWKEMAGRNRVLGKEMEVDLFLHDTTDSIAVEVKTHCTVKKIQHFLDQMQWFKQIFPEFADNTIYVAVAAIDFEKEALEFAKEKGIFIIRVCDDVFSLDPADKSTMLTY